LQHTSADAYNKVAEGVIRVANGGGMSKEHASDNPNRWNGKAGTCEREQQSIVGYRVESLGNIKCNQVDRPPRAVGTLESTSQKIAHIFGAMPSAKAKGIDT
jgi:hypothetical protein